MNLRSGGEQEEGEREPWLAYKMNIFFFFTKEEIFSLGFLICWL